eukprot:scaffold8682_cov122-Cylindrotheca_fusiformis.AAC.5
MNQDIYQPSDSQQKVISILVIPSSILSFIGSSLIVHCVRNEKQKRSPYRRLMLALSICDIISTIGYIFHPFLGPTDIPYAYVWAFGNSATCTFMGALLQISFSAHWYAGALSFYFLSTVRFGTREATFSKKYERWIHIIILLFSLSTAVAGIVMDVFHARRINPGCWVSHPDVCYGMNCHAEIIAWIFAGIPTLVFLFLVIINNLLLYSHVRKTILAGQKRALELERSLMLQNGKHSETSLGNVSCSVTDPSSMSIGDVRHGNKKESNYSILRSSEKQWKRVKDVGTQSFLYVGAYLITFVWSATINILNGRDFEKKHSAAETAKLYFPLLILQSIFTPAQGFFNALVFFRPKYNRCRVKYPQQSRGWAVRRALFGERISEDIHEGAASEDGNVRPTPPQGEDENKVDDGRVEEEVLSTSSLGAIDESEHFFVNDR